MRQNYYTDYNNNEYVVSRKQTKKLCNAKYLNNAKAVAYMLSIPVSLKMHKS